MGVRGVILSGSMHMEPPTNIGRRKRVDLEFDVASISFKPAPCINVRAFEQFERLFSMQSTLDGRENKESRRPVIVVDGEGSTWLPVNQRTL